MAKTPIAIFTYNRPDHARQLFDSLLKCARLQECDVFIFCDGAKTPEYIPLVRASRRVVHEYAVRLNAEVVEHDQNLGLAHSIVGGVTGLCQEYGRTIVLEDDLILHPFFLDFMLQALDRYTDDERVAQVAGYLPPIRPKVRTNSFFLPVSSSCGWATWQRAWDLFSWDAGTALTMMEADPSLQVRFDLDDSYPYFNMLSSTFTGHTDSWGILWYWQTFYHRKLTLYPSHSLVWVGGFDNFATNTKSEKKPKFYDQSLFLILRQQWRNPISFPKTPQVNNTALSNLKNLLRRKPKVSLFIYAKGLLKKILNWLENKFTWNTT